jgi:hypothetical protein
MNTSRVWASLVRSAVLVTCLGIAPVVSAQTPLASATFSTYSAGTLVGQNGWLQYNTQSTNPLQVTGGSVSWIGSGTTPSNDQDAMLAFSQQITQPVTGTNVINYDLLLSVGSSGTGLAPSYFAALNEFTGTTTTGNFQNVRLAVQSSGTGFVFGSRVNGQAGYPFGFGTTVLAYNQPYALRAQFNQVSGTSNDFINLYVGPDFNSLTLYGTSGWNGVGAVTDPSAGAMLLSQFSSATAFGSTISVQSIAATLVPEPSTLVLAGLGLVAGGWAVRRGRAAIRRPRRGTEGPGTAG